MTSNVTKLRENVVINGEPQEHIIKVLTDALERAKTGDVLAVAIATLDADGGSSHVISCPGGSGRRIHLLGAVTSTLHTLAKYE